MGQDQALALAVLREQRDPFPDGVAGPGDAQGPAVEPDGPALGTLRSKDEAGGLGAPGAHQPGEAHDFAAADRERYAADPAAPEPLHGQPGRGRRGRRPSGKLLVETP